MTSQLICDFLPSSVTFDDEVNYHQKFSYTEKTGNVHQQYEFTVEDFLIYVVAKICTRCSLEDYDPVSKIFNISGYDIYGISSKEMDFLLSIVRFIMNGKQLTSRQIAYLKKVVNSNVIKQLEIDEDSIVEIKDSNTKLGIRNTVEKVKEIIFIGDGKYCIRFPYNEKLNSSIKAIARGGYSIELSGHIGNISDLTATDLNFLKNKGFHIDSLVDIGRDICCMEENTEIHDLDGYDLIAYSNNFSVGNYITLLMETGNI